jgi:ribosomal protein L32
MDKIGEQTGGPTLTDAQRRKIEKDKTRVRRGNVQLKKQHVLNNCRNTGWSNSLLCSKFFYNAQQK